MDTELRKNALDMMPHRVRAHVELFGNLPVRSSPREQPRDLRLTLGQPELSEAQLRVPPQIRIAMFSRLLDNDDVLASIRVPTLVVHGRNDRVVKVSAAQHTAKLVPHATLLVYPGVGHAPHLEVATRFNRDLAEFVRSIR